MHDTANRKLETFRRVKDFGAARSADFSATSLATQLFTSLSTTISTLDGLAAAQTSGGGAAREGTATRGDARDELRARMKAWSATAHAIAIDNPGLDEKFRVPRGENDEILVAAARAGINESLDEGTSILRKLDPIMRNKYADDPATLAEWTSASHIERAPKHKATEPTQPPATPTA